MKLNIYSKEKIITISIFFLFFINLSSLNSISNRNNELITIDTPANCVECYDLKNSYFNNTLSPIYIDDSLSGVGAQNWTWASNQPWCSGSGTWSDPYLLENLTIDAQNASSGIEILNSNRYFIFNNVTVYNSSGTGNFEP